MTEEQITFDEYLVEWVKQLVGTQDEIALKFARNMPEYAFMKDAWKLPFTSEIVITWEKMQNKMSLFIVNKPTPEGDSL